MEGWNCWSCLLDTGSLMNNPITDLLAGFRYREMRVAKEWLLVPPPSNPHVAVIGDYDCDGICSSAIIIRTLETIGWRVTEHVARRASGYGSGSSLFDEVMQSDPSVVVVCDMGTNDFEGVKRFVDYGKRVVIIDHHLPDSLCTIHKVPHHMVSLINPLTDNKSGHSKEKLVGLCSSGLARILSEYLVGTEGGRLCEEDEFASFIRQIACIGTVGDMADITNEINATIIAEGIEAIKNAAHPAVSTMISSSFDKNKTIDYRFLAFNVCPVINAPGKIYDDAYSSLAMFIKLDKGFCVECAKYCIRCNNWRKGESERCARKAEVNMVKFADGTGIIYGEFPIGLVGSIANRLLKFNLDRCICVTTATYDSVLKGSARGENVLEYLEGFRDSLVRLGGHKNACGFTIERIRLQNLYDYVRMKDIQVKE